MKAGLTYTKSSRRWFSHRTRRADSCLFHSWRRSWRSRSRSRWASRSWRRWWWTWRRVSTSGPPAWSRRCSRWWLSRRSSRTDATWWWQSRLSRRRSRAAPAAATARLQNSTVTIQIAKLRFRSGRRSSDDFDFLSLSVAVRFPRMADFCIGHTVVCCDLGDCVSRPPTQE